MNPATASFAKLQELVRIQRFGEAARVRADLLALTGRYFVHRPGVGLVEHRPPATRESGLDSLSRHSREVGGAVERHQQKSEDPPAITPGGPQWFDAGVASAGSGMSSQPEVEVTTRGKSTI